MYLNVSNVLKTSELKIVLRHLRHLSTIKTFFLATLGAAAVFTDKTAFLVDEIA